MSGRRRLVLASASPRRRELLDRLGLEFVVRPSGADERARPGENPEAHVRRLAAAKAGGAARSGELVLGADTVVVLDGEILGKPGDEAEAGRMLARLSGREHEVWTGVALAAGDGDSTRVETRSCRTTVRFRALSDEEIAAYVASGEPADKAGAYAIQGGAAGFVESIDGDYENVVGLPLGVVRDLLESELSDSQGRTGGVAAGGGLPRPRGAAQPGDEKAQTRVRRARTWETHR